MSELAEVRARQIVQRMHRLRNEVEVFAAHARTLRLSSDSLDARVLSHEADNLLRGLAASRGDFQDATAWIGSLSRTLSSRPPKEGGPPPAAKWGNEFRAGSSQFVRALQAAENEIGQLYGAAQEQMNSPSRTATAPDNLIDVLVNFVDALSRWIEYRRRTKG
jgi:hypothetical protein